MRVSGANFAADCNFHCCFLYTQTQAAAQNLSRTSVLFLTLVFKPLAQCHYNRKPQLDQAAMFYDFKRIFPINMLVWQTVEV